MKRTPLYATAIGLTIISRSFSPTKVIDRKAGILYFWPPSPIEQGRAAISLLDQLITMTAAVHVSLQGLTLEAGRGTAIKID